LSRGKNVDCHMPLVGKRIRPNEIYDVVSAKIPDNDEDLLLHEIDSWSLWNIKSKFAVYG